MGNTPKHKDEEEAANGGGKLDIFKTLFGRDSTEEPGLGLVSEPKSDKKNKDKKKKREKEEKHDSNNEKLGSNSDSNVDSIKKKKKKKKKTVVNLEKKEEENPNLNVAENDEKKKTKKKRKRDEIEDVYEAKAYGVDEKIDGKNDEVGNIKSKKKVGEKRKVRDDPSETMVSREGFDDESKLLRTVFVGNLPLKTKKKALLKEFSQFGEVDSVRIRSVPILDGKMPRKGAIMKGRINDAIDSVNAYVVYKEEKSAQASLCHNMAMVGGNHIRVDVACPPRKKLKGENTILYDSNRTVFVGNIPFDVKDEELYQLFCGINQFESSIEAIRVIRDRSTNVGKGIAYVLLKTKEAASLLVRRRHLKLRDRDLRLYHAKPESVLSKKRELATVNNTPSKRMAISPSKDYVDRKVKSNLSYQGLRATKSGVQKKDGSRPRSGDRGMQKSSDGPERKVRDSKRPAVAARKAKVLKNLAAMKVAGTTPKQTGMKRKMESRTPQKSDRNTKPRKFR
ncbi:hypothetical protein C5167_032460 [Papaver somniferum]|uniref:RRM domain-containing protein n=1 Tax=Papaver somniferum TaxID=3469 RepID=A0A4Y7KAJ8_PAPSO|nr:RNA-binding protein 34-like [Papaver somniferum]RZC69362.1 hypothetical protein C5167_032460 [Papaver somniferum]